MIRKFMFLSIITVIIILSLFGCIQQPSTVLSGDVGIIRYYYDDTHDVGIWTLNEGGYGAAMVVLPGNQIKNKERTK
jgi:hypothetical protein